MNRVRIFACAGAGMVLATFGWCLPDAAGASAAMISRSVGLALFGIAMVAAGLVFRAAMRTGESAPPSKMGPGTSEFRRGFDKRGEAVAKRSLGQNEVVVTLRRAIAEQAQKPQPALAKVTLPPEQIERLQDMLHSRAAALRARNAGRVKQRFLRSGVDIHGLAGS